MQNARDKEFVDKLLEVILKAYEESPSSIALDLENPQIKLHITYPKL